MLFSNQLKIPISKPMPVNSANAAVCGGAALRKLAIANCSTVLTRLDLVMRKVKGNTQSPSTALRSHNLVRISERIGKEAATRLKM